MSYVFHKNHGPSTGGSGTSVVQPPTAHEYSFLDFAPEPIVSQPSNSDTNEDWIVPPRVGGLEGLELLDSLRHVDIKPLTTSAISERMLTFERWIRYEIFEGDQRIFSVSERPSRAPRETLEHCTYDCGRFTKMTVADFQGTPILIMETPSDCRHWLCDWICCCCCFGIQGGVRLACTQKVRVTLPNGKYVGSIDHEFGCFCKTIYFVTDSDEEHILTIRGIPCRDCCGTGRTAPEEIYSIFSANTDDEVGRISRFPYPAVVDRKTKYTFSFGLDFPPESDVNVKSLLVGAVFLIDYLYYAK